MLNKVSFGLNNPNNVTVKACVPEINWFLTKLSSALKICEYIFSIVSLPISLYPYPVVVPKCISDKLLSWNAFKTFILLISHILKQKIV